MRLLAARMGLTHPALRASDEEIAASALPEDVELESLKAEGWRKKSPARAAVSPGSLRLSGITRSSVVSPGSGRLQLLTPKSHYFMNSSFANMPRQTRAMRRPTLEIHPADAAARGLEEGTRVEICNERGAVQAWIRITDGVRPGVVALPGKWWGTEASPAVGNVLTPSAWSPGGQPAYNEAWVEVRAMSGSAEG